MLVTKNADDLAGHPNGCVEHGRNAKRLEIIFRQAARGRVPQYAVGHDEPFRGKRLKIGRTIREAQPDAFELRITAFRVAQIEDFTSNSRIIFLQ